MNFSVCVLRLIKRIFDYIGIVFCLLLICFPSSLAYCLHLRILITFDFYRSHSSILARFSCMLDTREEHMPRIAMGICKSIIDEHAYPSLLLLLFFLAPIFSCIHFSITVASTSLYRDES